MKSKKLKKIIALMATSTLLMTTLACGNSTATSEADATATDEVADETAEAEAIAEAPALTLEEAKAIYLNPEAPVEERVAALLSQMTIEEKVGQMVQGEQVNLEPSDVTKYYLGSVLSGGGSSPSYGNMAADWQKRVNELKQGAKDTRLGIPLIYGVDAVHGNNNVFGATVFPHNIGLGAAADAELMKNIGQVVAEETRAIGVPWTFAPCIGNPQNVSWGRSYECFSEKTDDIVPLVKAYVEGLQGELSEGDYMDNRHVVACAKHFIGEGYTVDGINQGNVDMTPEEFDALLASGVLDPYAAAVDANVLTVMASYNSVNGVKCHENHHLLTEVLKEQLGFKGFVVGDYNAIEQTSGVTYKDQVEICVNAGLDMIMEPSTWKECCATLLELVDEGRITNERIDDAVGRILYAKFTAGLFEEEIGNATEQELLEAFGSDEHREVARQAVRESLVLLKNEKLGEENVFDALKNAKSIAVSGAKAFDLGSQCGGWTITWQGMTGNKNTKGTTIIQGIANQVGEDVSIKHSVDGSIEKGTDAVIAVFGEGPYAETDGDRKVDKVRMAGNDEEMLAGLRESTAGLPDNVPVIGIIVAGRPIDISDYEDIFDAIIMAWLPGTEGDGVADMLFGDYDFNGKLTYTWMLHSADIGNADGEVLYPYGWGLKKVID